jgi:hypothetical protein
MILDLAFIPVRGNSYRFPCADFSSVEDAERTLLAAMSAETTNSFRMTDGSGEPSEKVHIVRFSQIQHVIVQPYDPHEQVSLAGI